MAAPVKSVRSTLVHERGLSKRELENIFSEAHHCLTPGVQQSQCILGLRRLFLAIACTKHHRELPRGLLRALAIIVLGTNTSLPGPLSESISLLCSAILQEYGPCDQLAVELGAGQASNLGHIPYLLPVILAQGQHSNRLERLVPQMVKWVSTVGFNPEIQCRALDSLVTIATQHRHLLSNEQVYVVGSQLSDWLCNASTTQAPSPHSKQKTTKQESVTEIDGRESQDFFTLLSLAAHYGPDQLLNIHAFSCLRAWLLATTTQPTTATTARGRSPTSPPPGSLHSEARERRLPSHRGEGDRGGGGEGKFTSKARKALIEKACEYCLRVIDLCHRRPLKRQDQDLIQACLVEAIETLTVICKLDVTLVSKLYPAIKQVHTNLAPRWPRVQIAILQFFLDNNEAVHVVFNPIETFTDLFTDVITRPLYDDLVTFDLMTFVLKNLQKLCLDTDLLQKFAPGFLKILAWNPRTYLADFVELLPAMISPGTAKEMLHTLLDLPCTTAALILTHRERQLRESPALAEIQSSWLTSVSILRTPAHQPWFSFVLRNQSGKGDTITKLDFLFKLISSLTPHPRVLICSQAVPNLIRLYFKVVLQHADYDLVSQLLPIVLERSAIIFPIPSYQTEIRRVLSDALLDMFRLHPSLVVDERAELQDFVGPLRHIQGKEDFFSHVVWIIGQYTSSKYDQRCTLDVIQGYYECLETLLYEVSVLVLSSTEPRPPYSIRLIVILMTTLAKLASRCQDLIPRVILCLTKISQQQTRSRVVEEDKKVLLSRATELVNLLKLPDIASAILSPSPDIQDGRWHSDINKSVPLLLKTASQLVHAESS